MDISVKKVNKQIEEFETNGEKPKILEIGYKTYAKLMDDDRFVEALTKDSKDSMIRFYKDIKIKMVTEKHHFLVK